MALELMSPFFFETPCIFYYLLYCLSFTPQIIILTLSQCYKAPARSDNIAGEERAQQCWSGGRAPSKPNAENGYRKKVTEKYQKLRQLSNGHNLGFLEAFLGL